MNICTITAIFTSDTEIWGSLYRNNVRKSSFVGERIPDRKSKLEIIFRLSEGKIFRPDIY